MTLMKFQNFFSAVGTQCGSMHVKVIQIESRQLYRFLISASGSACTIPNTTKGRKRKRSNHSGNYDWLEQDYAFFKKKELTFLTINLSDYVQNKMLTYPSEETLTLNTSCWPAPLKREVNSTACSLGFGLIWYFGTLKPAHRMDSSIGYK